VNYKIKEIMRFLVMFPMMILSCAVSGAFLLCLQFSLLYFSVLIPLFFASFVSCRGFYQFMSTMEEASCPAKTETQGNQNP
jgi:hypothetical protein